MGGEGGGRSRGGAAAKDATVKYKQHIEMGD